MVWSGLTGPDEHHEMCVFRPALHPFLQRPARRETTAAAASTAWKTVWPGACRAHRRIQEFIDPEQLVLFFKLPALFYEGTNGRPELFSWEALRPGAD